jgi:hypothetical protein
MNWDYGDEVQAVLADESGSLRLKPYGPCQDFQVMLRALAVP